MIYGRLDMASSPIDDDQSGTRAVPQFTPRRPFFLRTWTSWRLVAAHSG